MRRVALGIIWAAAAIVFIFSILALSPHAKGDGGTVYVMPDIPDADQITLDLRQRLYPDDGISIEILGDGLHVQTLGWPDSLWVANTLSRVKVVAVDPVDQAKRMIRLIHQWQDANPKPEPKIEMPPAPPYDWTPWIAIGKVVGGIISLALALYIVYLVQAHRRAKKLAILREFDSFDPSNPYGKYKPVDLGE